MALALLLTIALGIGSNASVLGFIHGLVTPDLPIAGIDTVVSLFARDAQDAFGPVSYERYLWLKSQSDTFESLGAARESQGTVVVGGRASVLSLAAATPELADLLHLSLQDGVVISRRLWQNEFEAATGVRGQPIRIEGADTRVAEVAPAWLEGLYTGRPVDVWVPLPQASLQNLDRVSLTFWALGRLRPGVSIDQAQAALNGSPEGVSAIAVRPYTGVTPEVAAGMSRIGRLLAAAAGVVFFIACANVAAFLLARASARSRETSVRVAIGASRGQLGRQLLADSVLIAVTGGAFGMLLAVWTGHIIPSLFFDQDAEHLVFSPDLSGILFASAVCVGITVVCGLLPLVDIRYDDPAAVLRREGRGPSNAMRRLRAGLVVGQMACCCLLVISTGVLLAGFRTALRTSAGLRLGRPIIATLEARQGFARPDLSLEYFRQVEQAVRSLPDVTGTAWTDALPGGRPRWRSVRIEPPDLPQRDVAMDVVAFTPGTFAHVRMPPVAGRMFGARDTPAACKVVLVNEEAAALFNGNVIGQSLEDPAGEPVEIIGVVSSHEIGRANAPSPPMIYYYAEQTRPPLGRTGTASFRAPVLPEATSGALDANAVSESYFDVMGFSPMAGQVFAKIPTRNGCRVGVINEEAAELYFGGHAVGGAVIDGAGQRTEIVAVIHSVLLRTSQRRVEPAIYLPMGQDSVSRMTLIVGARSSANATVAAVRRLLERVPGGNPDRMVVTSLDDYLSRTALAPERIATVLVGASAALALTLSLIGMYGAIAEAARQRRREIALRLALGAQSWRVIRQLIAEGMRLAGLGTVVGVLGSFLASRWLTRITPSATVPAPWVWLAAPVLLVMVVGMASIMPARRALTVDLLTLMQDE